MRKLLFAITFVLFAGFAQADDAQHWGIKSADTWRDTDNVSVRYFFTENGIMVGQAELFIGPLLPGQERPVVTTQFVNSNREICLNAEAFRAAEPNTTVAAVPNCYRFPFSPLDPPTITVTP